MDKYQIRWMAIFFCLLFWGVVAFAFIGNAFAAQGMFQWSPNSEPDLAGYKIYCKTDTETDYPAQGIDVGLPATGDDGKVHSELITVPDTSASCVATAYDNDGNESNFSNPATFNLAPMPPQGFAVDVTVNVHVNTN